MTRKNSASVGGKVFLLAFGMFWCGVVGVFDWLLGGIVARQALTAAYSEGKATILESSVEEGRTSKGGRTYGVKVTYAYLVSGREHTSDRLAFNSMKTSNSRWARETVRRLAKGSEAPVYYDPNRPERSVLRRGLDGHDLFMLMFLAPFNAIAAGLLALGGATVRAGSRAGGVLHSRSGRSLREHIDAGGAGIFAAFLAALGLSSFLSIFIVALTGGFHPSPMKVGIVWMAVLSVSIWAAMRAWAARRRGDYEIVIDRQNGTLSLPPMHGRKTRREWPMAQIQSVQAVSLPPPKNRRRRTLSHEVQLLLRDGERQTVFQPWNLPQAELMAEALREKLGISPGN